MNKQKASKKEETKPELYTVLYAGFPGTGKSTMFRKYANTDKKVIDSDSSKFDKKNFPENYIKHIKDNIGKVDVICISSHKEVRKALVENNLLFTLIYPDRATKNEYLNRYKDRGNSSSFIELIDKNWDLWIDECEEQKGCEHIVLPSMIFMADVV
jgi:nucleoside-triphosphatase THEP1